MSLDRGAVDVIVHGDLAHLRLQRVVEFGGLVRGVSERMER